MKLIFLKGKKSNNPTQPDELTYTLNDLPPNLTVSTLLEIGQNIPPIDNNLTNEPPTLAVSTAVSAQ